jgi:hypothetical protein
VSSRPAELASTASRARRGPLWFQSLPLEERMALLVELTDLALQNRPELAEAPPAQPSTQRVRVLRLPRP